MKLLQKPKRLPFRFLFGILYALSVMFSGGAAVADTVCKSSIADIRLDDIQVRFRVEIAKTERARARGLMHRESMARSRGMLFVYERPHRASFWMKNTIIPLDILFLDQTGTVTHIAENTVPFSLEPIDGGEDVVLVLEVNAGLVSRFRLGVGAQLRHPEVDQSLAVWKCEQ